MSDKATDCTRCGAPDAVEVVKLPATSDGIIHSTRLCSVCLAEAVQLIAAILDKDKRACLTTQEQ